MSMSRYSPFSQFFGGFDDFFAPSPFLLPSLTRDILLAEQQLQQQQKADKHRDGEDSVGSSMWRVFQPGVHFHEDDSNYSVSIDLPGVKLSDVTLKLEDDGKTVHLSGHRKLQSSDGKQVSESKFVKRFTIGNNVDIDKLSANLSDGVLTLTAPKKEPAGPTVKEIKITESGGVDPSSVAPAKIEAEKK